MLHCVFAAAVAILFENLQFLLRATEAPIRVVLSWICVVQGLISVKPSRMMLEGAQKSSERSPGGRSSERDPDEGSNQIHLVHWRNSHRRPFVLFLLETCQLVNVKSSRQNSKLSPSAALVPDVPYVTSTTDRSAEY